jgi:transposase
MLRQQINATLSTQGFKAALGPYHTLKGALHALCNALHVQDLKALVEIEKEDWARCPVPCNQPLTRARRAAA